MDKINANATKVIEAPPEKVYAVLANYNESHPAILPKHVFSDLVVEQGGIGAGTVVRVTMAAPGKKQELHVTVSEPEPGRVMVESGSGMVTTFTVEPMNEGRSSQVTIAAEATPSPGLQGWVERLVTPALLWDELHLLAKFVEEKSWFFYVPLIRVIQEKTGKSENFKGVEHAKSRRIPTAYIGW
jgi:hypothetical protein